MRLIQLVDNQTAAELRFEPGSLRRHNVTRICNVHQLLHCYGMQRQSDLHFATIHRLLQLTQTTDTSYKVDALIATQIGNSEDITQNQVT